VVQDFLVLLQEVPLLALVVEVVMDITELVVLVVLV
jgi:hypothetical protein